MSGHLRTKRTTKLLTLLSLHALLWTSILPSLASAQTAGSSPPQIEANSVPANQPAPEGEDRVIVVFKNQKDRAAIEQLSGKVKKELKYIPGIVAMLPKSKVEKLKQQPNVKAVEPDVTVQIAGQTVDWGIGAVQAPVSWNQYVTGAGVKVAVLDSGIAAHEDLQIAGGVSFVDTHPGYDEDELLTLPLSESPQLSVSASRSHTGRFLRESLFN